MRLWWKRRQPWERVRLRCLTRTTPLGPPLMRPMTYKTRRFYQCDNCQAKVMIEDGTT